MKTSATQGAWSVIPRSVVSAALALLARLLAVSGGPAATPQDEEPEKMRMTIEEARVEAAGWPNFDSTAFGDQVVKREAATAAAAEEAAAWPDFDPSSHADYVARTEAGKLAAAEEAAGWPDFDPSSMADRLTMVEAARAAAADEAAGWPDFDSTAMEASSPADLAAPAMPVHEMLRGGLSPIPFDA